MAFFGKIDIYAVKNRQIYISIYGCLKSTYSDSCHFLDSYKSTN